ncbi:MAG: MurR/RpiR family transcriptional regulator [Lachnospiraceae bacterium]|nr:MurR/RpiR family transcriptional regulator [Lachnospiraceae bacterium]
MNSNILDEITRQYNTMSRSNKKLADYILSTKTSAQYMSITSMAENCGVAEATITRFCRLLGLGGYNDFKLALAKALGSSTANANVSMDLGVNILNDEGLDSMCKKLYIEDMNALNETLELLNEHHVTYAVNLLSQARHVYCFGQGGSNVMAMEAWARFATATPKFIHISDSHMQAMAASLCTEQDVILFFSYSGSTKDMLDLIGPERSGRARVILITHFPKSPASSLADVILLCGSNESPLQSGSVAAKIGQMFIIDYLYCAFCKKNPELVSKNLDSTTKAISQKLL